MNKPSCIDTKETVAHCNRSLSIFYMRASNPPTNRRMAPPSRQFQNTGSTILLHSDNKQEEQIEVISSIPTHLLGGDGNGKGNDLEIECLPDPLPGQSELSASFVPGTSVSQGEVGELFDN